MMIPLSLKSVKTVLCLGCHADDIEIGCGGALLHLLQQNPELQVWWVVLSGAGPRKAEARRSAERFLQPTKRQNVLLRDFRDRFFPYEGEAVKNAIHEIAADVSPDVVFTHRLEDRHQDHRLVAEVSWNAFRNHLLLEYEIPKYEGDLGQPNVFVPLEEELCRRKVSILRDAFPSQQDKPWFSEDTFWALLRLRGLECNSPSRFAEAFHCRKLTLA
jgi:LmbE family N-acetylglucosaminyl deacetylase